MLEISSFADPGVHAKERLVIKAISDVDIGKYAVFRSGISDEGKPVSGSKIAYWFPDQQIKAGDLVVLYTKTGKSSKKEISGGHTAYFYYWHRDNSLWGTGKHTAVLLRIAEWTHEVSQSVAPS
jgi:hypothetical protein